MSDQRSIQLARRLGIRFGAILGGVLAVLEVGFYWSDLYGESFTSVLNWSLILGAMIGANWIFRDQNQGLMTLGQGFRVGLTTAVIGATLQAVVGAIYTTLIDPDAIDRYLNRMRIDLLSEPGFAEEAVDLAINYTEKMSQPFFAIPMTIIATAFFGALGALIIALILQKRPG